MAQNSLICEACGNNVNSTTARLALDGYYSSTEPVITVCEHCFMVCARCVNCATRLTTTYYARHAACSCGSTRIEIPDIGFIREVIRQRPDRMDEN